MTPRDIPDDLRFEYRFTVASYASERHDWCLIGEHGAINVWAEPSAASSTAIDGRRWFGGIECHYAKAPDHAEYCGHRTDCWLTGGECWHDGSSLQFSEEVSPMLPEPQQGPLPGHIGEMILPILKHRYRTWFASAIEAPSGVETGNTDSTEGESAVGEAETPND